MMPLSMANVGERMSIKSVNGKDEMRSYLASLGFVPSSQVTVVNRMGGNIIVNVKESRVAVSRDLAANIMV